MVETQDDDHLREVLTRLEPEARVRLRKLLVADAAHRDRVALTLLRMRSDIAEDMADILDMLTIDGEARRLVRDLKRCCV